ncbi:MAG: glycogen synthase, partial [Phycisphaerae bacterium]
LNQKGTVYHFGRWLISGYPKAILIDLQPAQGRLNELKYTYWQDFGISLPDSDPEAGQAIAFADMVVQLLAEFVGHNAKRPTVAHFHEWLASAAIPPIRRRRLPVATVFTTHATLLGRYLCTTWRDFYDRLPSIDVDHEAGIRQIYHRYCLERAAAHGANVLTTVSEVTGREAEHLLKRRPDLITPNGLQVEKFAALHEFQNLHAHYKERIHQFVRGHFFGSYAFDLENTVYFFTAGRYEYQNKGMDLFIESLYRLNGHLKHIGSEKTVVAFIITPAAVKNVNVDSLNNAVLLDELRKLCDHITDRLGRRMFDVASAGRMPDTEHLLSEREIIWLKRMIYTRRRSTLPAIVTHEMEHDDQDVILSHLRHRRLFNAPDDKVKIVYHPQFLSATNPLLGIEYDEFVRGCHLGVFPSYYEPWGYTPAECTLMGVPSVTSNLSGFGTFIAAEVPDHARRGIYVIDRRGDTGEALDELTQIMIEFCEQDRRQRIQQRNRTERLSELLDWAHLGQAYHRAHDLALSWAGRGFDSSG